MKLFLDDTRNPYDVFQNTIDFDYYENKSWDIVKSYDEFVSYIKENGIPTLISFDHDLSVEHYRSENQTNIDYDQLTEKTGYHALVWLIDFCNQGGFNLPKMNFHTQNIEGKRNMESLII